MCNPERECKQQQKTAQVPKAHAKIPAATQPGQHEDQDQDTAEGARVTAACTTKAECPMNARTDLEAVLLGDKLAAAVDVLKRACTVSCCGFGSRSMRHTTSGAASQLSGAMQEARGWRIAPTAAILARRPRPHDLPGLSTCRVEISQLTAGARFGAWAGTRRPCASSRVGLFRGEKGKNDQAERKPNKRRDCKIKYKHKQQETK